MTKASKAAVEKANALIRAIVPENVLTKIAINPASSYIDDAFARFIDHVSEVAKDVSDDIRPIGVGNSRLDALILPDPEPDVLAEALRSRLGLDGDDYAAEVREYFSDRGYEIRKVQP